MANNAGGKRILHSTCILLSDAELGQVQATEPEWPLIIELSFHPEEGPAMEVAHEPIEGGVQFRFRKWDNPLGTSFNMPISIGTSNGQTVSLAVFHHRVGIINRIDLQVMTG